MKDLGAGFGSSIADGMRDSLRAPAEPTLAVPEWALCVADLALAAHSGGGRERLASVFKSALDRAVEQIDEVSIVATGLEWLGGGVGAVERTAAELIAGAQREIVLTVYSITPGSERVWDEIERALVTGVRCTAVVDRLKEQHIEMQSLLARLAGEHPQTFRIYDFAGESVTEGLHAKVLVVDRRTALVGSANLSHRGMVSAHELAVVVRGPTGERIAEQVDRLLRSACVKRFP